MMVRSSPGQGGWRTFTVPCLLAVMFAFGLLSALIGDGAWDVLSWFALGVPLALVGFHVFRR